MIIDVFRPALIIAAQKDSGSALLYFPQAEVGDQALPFASSTNRSIGLELAVSEKIHLYAHSSGAGVTSSCRPPNTAVFAVVFSLIVIALLYVAWHRSSQRASKDPKTWPILGSQLEASKHYDCLYDWTTSFFSGSHRTLKMSSLSRCTFLTVDPANVEHILKTNFANYPKGAEAHERLHDMHGEGILNVDGETWRTHRKIASLEFSVRKLKALTITSYREGALKLAQALMSSIVISPENHDSSSNSTRATVDIQNLFCSMTFETICKVVLGRSSADAGYPHEIAAAIDNALEMITRRHMFPWWRLQRFFNVGSERLLREEMGKLDSFFSGVIRRRKMEAAAEAGDEGEPRRLESKEDVDLLSRFLEYQHQVQQQHHGHQKGMMSDEEVGDAVLNLVMAGRDTTASALTWFMYCMCCHPEEQERVYQEAVSLEERLLPHGHDRTTPQEFATLLSYDTMQGLHYTHAALAETLRLYPSVPRDGKVALHNDVLPDGTRLKAGDQVAYVPYAMGRMKFLWGEDALVFRPNRWLDDRGNFQPQSPYKFSAFQACALAEKLPFCK